MNLQAAHTKRALSWRTDDDLSDSTQSWCLICRICPQIYSNDCSLLSLLLWLTRSWGCNSLSHQSYSASARSDWRAMTSLEYAHRSAKEIASYYSSSFNWLLRQLKARKGCVLGPHHILLSALQSTTSWWSSSTDSLRTFLRALWSHGLAQSILDSTSSNL